MASTPGKVLFTGLALTLGIVLSAGGAMANGMFGNPDNGEEALLAQQFDELGPSGKMRGSQRLGPGQARGSFLKDLNLTDEQKQKLKVLMGSRRQQHKGGRQELQAKRQQLMQMIKSGSGSKEKALALHRQISAEQSKMMEGRISMIYDMKAILTPDQFQTLSSKMQQRRGRFGSGQGSPGGMGMDKGQFHQKMQQHRSDARDDANNMGPGF